VLGWVLTVAGVVGLARSSAARPLQPS
jgi:hypothetical protein